LAKNKFLLSRFNISGRALGSEGGKITTPHAPHLEVFFPKGALQKKIKVSYLRDL